MQPKKKFLQIQDYMCLCVCVCFGTMALCLCVGSVVGTAGDSSEDRRDLILSSSVWPFFVYQAKKHTQRKQTRVPAADVLGFK